MRIDQRVGRKNQSNMMQIRSRRARQKEFYGSLEWGINNDRRKNRIWCCANGMGLQSLYCGRDGAKLLRGFMFRRGGGTDFSPAIAEAAKWEPDLPIYLTDLEGEAGEEPTFPVLSAVPEGKSDAPWGKVVELD